MGIERFLLYPLRRKVREIDYIKERNIFKEIMENHAIMIDDDSSVSQIPSSTYSVGEFRGSGMNQGYSNHGLWNPRIVGARLYLMGDYELSQNDIDEVHVVYNRFKTLASQELMMEKVLPVDFTTDYNAKDYNYDYEPGQKEIVSTLIPKHVTVQMWQQLLESYSSEEAARMIAMDNATENAKEIIKELKLEFNKARQAAITTEMLEIVGGAEALVD